MLLLIYSMTTSLVFLLQVYFICPQNPVNFYSKKHITVDKDTHGSEFVSYSIFVEQIIGFQNTLRYLNVPIHQKICMFKDKKYVIDSAIHLHTKLRPSVLLAGQPLQQQKYLLLCSNAAAHQD